MRDDWILTTPRLALRPLQDTDFDALCETLQDPQAMKAYEHGFSKEEVSCWLSKQQARYAQDGVGLWAVTDRENGIFLGQCGITMQPVEDRMLPEIGYLFPRKHWHQGYATEAAVGCKRYGFDQLGYPALYSIIREGNAPSIAVAKRNGMTEQFRIVKHYYGMEMPHIVYRITREEDAK